MARNKIETIGSKDNKEKLEKLGSVNHDKTEWDAYDVETPNSDPMLDDGSGKKIILRRFDYELPPLPEGIGRPPEEEIVNFHKASITRELFKDNLVQCGDFRFFMNKNGKNFHIFVPAEPRSGHALLERTQTINEILTNGNQKSPR